MKLRPLLPKAARRGGLVLLLTAVWTGLALAGKRDIPKPLTDADFHNDGVPVPAKFFLGQMLFFDKIISGNQNISCATCHHSLTDTGDGLSLPVGEGGAGLGVTRNTGEGAAAVHERVPRNAPPVFNLGAREFVTVFHDGRIQADAGQPSGFRSPAGNALPAGLDNALAAQAMFPVTSGAEMAGQAGENPVADFSAANDLPAIWDALAQRLRAVPEYVQLFRNAFPGEVNAAGDITFVHAANAIAAFEAFAWRADKSPFDRYLNRDRRALSLNQLKGMALFYNKSGNCHQCHSGKLLSDQGFHGVAMPQAGPGKGDGFMGLEDFGRERVTLNPEDRYRFRTPPLKNVALTGPWGHDGAYNSLRDVVRHHLNPEAGLESWGRDQFIVPPRPDLDAKDFVVHGNRAVRAALLAQSDLEPRTNLNDRHVDYLVDFLQALTDPNSIDLRLDVPIRVPSGLPVFD